jgi:pterin-4a-carbinolamine dehydratase
MELLEQYGSELNIKSRSKTRPKITFYEGLDGLEKVYEDTLTSRSGLKSWASYDHLLDVMPDYFADYFKRRSKKKIKMTSIHPDTAKARAAQARDAIEFRESALIPAEKFDWQPEIQVYDNKVNITSWKEKIGIIIESEEIANAFRAIFELSYEAAKRYGRYLK